MNETIRLHYHRPPDRTDIFEQELLYQDDDVFVTFAPRTPLLRPVVVDGAVVLARDSPAIWFTFPERLHDIGRFHTAQGAFTGLYANIITPIEMQSAREWRTTDLFVDVWIGAGGNPSILDADELAHAVASGWISAETGSLAQAEAQRIVTAYLAGAWPPAVVNDWTIERVSRARLSKEG